MNCLHGQFQLYRRPAHLNVDDYDAFSFAQDRTAESDTAELLDRILGADY